MSKPMTSAEAGTLLHLALEECRLYPQLRYGQAISNILAQKYPEIAGQVIGTDKDPYYATDPKNEAYVKFIAWLLGQEES